ncbi:uncharacterized protein KY384_001020 [Bacidia gigantensis]|uniref:uncharacterized protein n=1 Tax=Bacidia gigantensis TaxID=2732470 RepID=UPI001D03D16B|nr:uncharacterized protein KY384_001020 [Bacidia gigantensis]KAG8534176.1 hypothetical protein KY384_001020 [Bacidia gigantensis]
MAGRKRAGSKRGASVEPELSTTTRLASKIPEVPTPSSLRIPAYLQFPILVALSMATSSVLYTVAAPFTSGDLASVSAQLDEWWEIGGILLWKAIELGAGWWLGYDVIHFDGIKDLSKIYRSDVMWLLAPFVPIGIAAKTFLFTPSFAAKADARDDEIEAFNPETASLSDTALYNIWGHSKRVRVLAQRTAVLVALAGLHTWLHTYIVVEGAEGFGAAGWASIWVLAATLTGLGFAWVGNIDG